MDGEIAFQPLARIDREGYRSWAAEWIEGRLLHEGVAVGPEEKAAVWSALGSLAGAPLVQRTMTGLSVLLQSNALRQALAPYADRRGRLGRCARDRRRRRDADAPVRDLLGDLARGLCVDPVEVRRACGRRSRDARHHRRAVEAARADRPRRQRAARRCAPRSCCDDRDAEEGA